jgi:transketolase
MKLTQTKNNKLTKAGTEIRLRVVDGFESASRGHIGSALSIVEILLVLFDKVLKYDPRKPKWPKRDRFILSKGHGCLSYYAILERAGFITGRQFLSFCRLDSILGGHPDQHIPGVEVSTGSLGHGLPVAVGMALAARIRQDKHRVIVLLGDGELNEGSVWEAALSAGHHHLSNLILIIDENQMQSYDLTKNIAGLEPLVQKWQAFGFAVTEVDGHDTSALQKTFVKIPLSKAKPTCVICHTVKGKGIKEAELNPHWHHKRGVTKAEAELLRKGIREYTGN